MIEVHEGQCGLCAHFGEHDPNQQPLIQIRTTHQASEDVIEECGHPTHAPLHLLVTPTSGCAGFEPVPEAMPATGS